MGDSLDQLTYLINLMEAREHQSCYQNHIPLAICNIFSSNFHGNDACPILLDTNFYGEDPHKHLKEFQVVCSAPSEPSLEDIVKQMAANNLQYQQQIDSTLQTLQTQIGQLATLMNAMQQAQGSNQQRLEEHSVFQIELLSENVDDACTDLFADDFPSLSDFDDVYSCFDCTDTNI